MSERKIIPPDDMIEAVLDALCERWSYRRENWPSVKSSNRSQVEFSLAAALTWLADHPKAPTQKDVQEFWSPEMNELRPFDQMSEACVRWQRRMFVAPELMIPEEIKDLLFPVPVIEKGRTMDANERIAEAFRRGQKVGN